MRSNICAIILYGSHSRKDNNAKSDIDICIFMDSQKSEKIDISLLENLTGQSFSADTNFVNYSTAILDLMIKNGSLFLWHLKTEGKILYGKEYFNKKIKNLKIFKGHTAEIRYHQELLKDLLFSWKCICIPNEFDLSLLFTLSRNTCMVLCHKKGFFSFSRMNSYKNAKKLFPDIPFGADSYRYLSEWKLIYERGNIKNKKLPSFARYKNLVTCVKDLLEYAKEKTN